MSSEPPPSPITSSFNLSAWIQAVGSGLSLATASTYFLSKKVADTALGLITFSSGIKTNSIDTTDATGGTNCSLFPNATNAIIDLGPTSAPAGQSSLIRLGLGSANIQCGSATSTLVSQIIDSFVGIATDISLYSSKTNAINMGSISTAIKIGNSQVGGNTLQLGSSSSAVSIPGGSTIGSITTNTINAVSALSSLSLNANLNSQVNIGTLSSRSSGIFIGSGASATGQVYINTGGSASGATNIMTGVNQSGNFNLGEAGNTVVINVNRPLTIGYAPSAITTTSQIGYTTTDTITLTGTLPNAVITPIFTAITLPTGVWLITYSVRFRSSGTTTIGSYYIWGQDSITVQTPPYAMNASNTSFITNSNGFSTTGTFVISSTGTTTYNIGLYIGYAGSDINIDLGLPDFGSVVKRTRIA